jgi:hypothetical protein
VNYRRVFLLFRDRFPILALQRFSHPVMIVTCGDVREICAWKIGARAAFLARLVSLSLRGGRRRPG